MSNRDEIDEFAENLKTIIEVRQALRGIRRLEEERKLIRFFAMLLSLFTIVMCLIMPFGFIMIVQTLLR